VTSSAAPQRKPTMIDVARLAGVSHMTVSRFLRDDPTIREDNRTRIAAAIAELDYRPNMVARSMRTRRRGLLAIIVPATTNAYSPARILSAATQAAHESGFEVETVSVDGGAEARTRRALELADSQLVEGIVSLAPLVDEQLGDARPGDVPVIAVADYDDELRGAGVLLDASPIITIVEHLAELGHRRFFHIGGPDDHPASHQRKLAYLEAVDRFGLTSRGVWQRDWSGDSGSDAVASLDADCGVTAIVCTNDELAAGAMQGAAARGWSVPGDVSITGWDDNPVGRYMPPGLTTVYVDHILLGHRTIHRLISLVRGEEPIEADLSGLNTVIWRGSVGPVRKSPL
jgi:DNA-binding LacI/PurR family transcriptional regulator